MPKQKLRGLNTLFKDIQPINKVQSFWLISQILTTVLDFPKNMQLFKTAISIFHIFHSTSYPIFIIIMIPTTAIR